MKIYVAMKRYIAVMLIFTLLIPLMPVYAAENTEPVDEQYPKGTFNLKNIKYEASEKEGSFSVEINRQSEAQGAADVDVHILNITASNGDDYTLDGLDTSLADEKEFTFVGTLHFEDGEDYKSFDINFIDDDISEGTESFMLALLDPSEGAKLGNNTSVTFNILDDEPEELSAISFKEPQIVTDRSMEEVSIDVIRTGGDYRMVTVGYSLYPSEEQTLFSYPVEGNLVFAPYETKKTITLPLEFADEVSGRIDFDIALRDCKGGHLGEISVASVTVLEVLNSEVEEKIDENPNSSDAIKGSVELEPVDEQYLKGTFNLKDTKYEISEKEGSFPVAINILGESQRGTDGSDTFNILEDEPEELSTISFKRPEIVTDSSMEEVSLEVIRTGGDNSKVTVAYSVYSSENQTLFSYPIEGNLNFMPNETEKTITVPLEFADELSGRINFDVALRDCKGGHLGEIPVASVTVLEALNSEFEEKANPFAVIKGLVEEDSVELPYIDFERDTYYANYGDDAIELTIVRKGNIELRSNVLIKTHENTADSEIDYQPVSEYLTFEPGEEEKIVSIPLMATDTGDSKSFYVYMAYPQGAEVEDNNRAKVILSPGRMMRMAAKSADNDELYRKIDIVDANWKNGVKGEHTSTSIKDNIMTLKIKDNGWFSNWNPDKYDVSMVTTSSYEITGYESIIIDWSKSGSNEVHSRVFISDKSNGNRGEDVLSYKHKDNFSQTDEYSFNNLTGQHFIRFNLAGEKSSTTMKVKSVKLKKRTYNLKTVATNQGRVETENTKTAYLGRVVKVMAYPAKGYKLKSIKFSNDGKAIEAYNRNFITFTVDQDFLIREKIDEENNNSHTIKIIPEFEKIAVPVTVDNCNGGDVLYNNQSICGQTINDAFFKENIELKAVPDEGKYFAGWNITGFDGLISDNPVKLTLLEEGYSVAANFEDKRKLTINPFGSLYGSVQADKDTYKAGEIAVLTASPREGYQVEWTVDSYSYVGNVFFLMMDTDKTVTAKILSKTTESTEPTQYHTVAGKIVDNKGQGIPNMKVMLPSGVNGISQTVTNSKGEYSFSKVKEYQNKILIATYDQSGTSGRVGIEEKDISNYVEEVVGNQRVVEFPNIIANISQGSLLPIRVQKADAYMATDMGAQKVTTVEIKEDNNIMVETSVAWNGSEPGLVNFMVRDYNGNIKKTIPVDASNLENPSHVVIDLNIAEIFSHEDELIVQAVSSNNRTSDLYVSDLEPIAASPDFDANSVINTMDDNYLPLPPDMPLFKALPEVGVGNFSTSLSYEDGAITFYIGIAATIYERGKGLQKPEDLKNLLIGDGIQTLGDAFNEAKAANFKSGLGVEVDVGLGGKLVWVYNPAKAKYDDGMWDLAGGYFVINGSVGVKKVIYFFPLGFPMYLSLGGGLDVELNLTWDEKPEEEDGKTEEEEGEETDKDEGEETGEVEKGVLGEFNPVVNARVATGVGIEGVFAGEAWVKGFAGGEIKFGIVSDKEFKIGAAAGLAGTIFGIFEGEWTVWDESIPDDEDEDEGQETQSLLTMNRARSRTVSDTVYSQTQSVTLKPLNRDYLKKQTVMTESPGMPKMKTFNSIGFRPVEENPLIESTYPASDPQIVKFDDKIMVVYIIDRGEESDWANCPMAVYTMYQWDGGQYELQGESYYPLYDDGTMDQNPYVYETEKSVVVAWASADREFNGNETINEINSSYEIQARFYDKDNGTWSDVHKVTDDPTFYHKQDEEGNTIYYKFQDSMPRIASNYDSDTGKESIMIAYQKMEFPESSVSLENLKDNEIKNIDFMQNEISIGYRIWDGNNWGEEMLLPYTFDKKVQIPTMDMISYDGLGILTYMRDGDGNIETNNDQEIYLHYFAFPNVLEDEDKFEGGWTKPIRMTTNEWMDTNPKLGLAGNDKSYLFWYSGDKIVYYHLKELYEYGFEYNEELEIWELKDGFSPYTAYVDETVYKDDPNGGEMQKFSFTIGEDGNVYILWTEFSEDGSNIYLSACSAETNNLEEGESTSELGVDGVWSKKYKITDNNSINRSFDAVIGEDGKVWIIYNKVAANLENLNNPDWKYERGLTDLYLSMFEPFTDFDIKIEENNKANNLFDFFKRFKRGEYTAIVNVTNTGIWKVNDPIDVTLYGYNKKGDKVFKDIITINPPIAGGETAQVAFKVPSREGVKKLKATAVKKNEVSSGVMKMSLFSEEPAKTDEFEIPSVALIKVNRKDPVFEDGIYTFGTLVTNEGIDTANNTVITLNLVDPENDSLMELDSETIDEIPAGASEDINFKPVEIDASMFDSHNIAKFLIKADWGEEGSKESSEYEILLNNRQEDIKTARNIFIDEDSISMLPGQIRKLNASLYPTTAVSELEWSSSNPDVAMVTKSSGFISAISHGKAVITVTALPEGITKECTLRVISPYDGDKDRSKDRDKDNEDRDNTTVIEEDGKKKTIVNVGSDEIEELISTEGEEVVLSIKNEEGTDALDANFDVELLKTMKDIEGILRLETGEVSYTIPAKAIDFEELIDDNTENATISVEVSPMDDDETAKLEKDLKRDGYTIVAPPVRFEITCNVGEKNFSIDKFTSYVERTIAIPDDINPADITTGAVVNPDGTLTHVPTKIIEKDGRYYAVINSLTNSTYVLIRNKVEFYDIDNHWAADAIKEMGDRKIVKGVGDGIFAPDTNVTRAMFSAITVRALGLNGNSEKNVFSDATEGDWFFGDVGTANEYGLMGGYTDGTFQPNNNITREEAMVVIARAAKLAGLDTDFDISLLNNFNDGEQVSKWARDAAASCVGLGIVKGSDGKIRPKDMITRAEAVVMIMRLLSKANLI